MVSLSRAPASADFILPRRAAYWWFEGFIHAQQAPGLRAAYSWAALLLAGAGLLGWLAALVSELAGWEPAARTLRRFLICAAAVLGAAWAGRWALSLYLDILRNVWFPPESLDWREPALAFLAASHAVWGVFGSSLAFCRAAGTLDHESSAEQLGRFLGRGGALLLPAALLWLAAEFRWDYSKKNLLEAGGSADMVPLETVFQVAVEDEAGNPAFQSRVIRTVEPGAAVASPRGMAALTEVARSRGVYALRALRALYQAYTLELDPEGLRNSLGLGHLREDPVARLLLLRNLSSAPAQDAAGRNMEFLADPVHWRFGPAAAALLAEAFGHAGRPDHAAYWRSQGRGGMIPPGLLAGVGETGVRRADGLVRGTFRGPRPRKAALFIREPGPDGYVIDPAGLVTAAVPDSKGKFEFHGLAEGDYFLVLSPPPGVSISRWTGAPGDIRIRERRRRIELKAIELK